MSGVQDALAPLRRGLEALRRRLALTVGRCVLKLVEDGGGLQVVQVSILKGETRPATNLQTYGFQSRPKPGAEGSVLAVGHRGHLVVLGLDDRRYRLELADGEVAVADDLGQKVHLTRDGIVVDAGANPVTFRSSTKVRFETPLLEATGDVAAEGDVSDKSGTAQTMAAMRATFDAHTHLAHGVTSGPSDLPVPPPNTPPMG